MTPLKWFGSFLKKYWLKILLGLVLATIGAILAIAYPQISGWIVDDVILKGRYNLMSQFLLLLLAASVTRNVLRFCMQMIFEGCSQGILFEMRDKVYRKLLMEDFTFYNKNRTGDLMSRQTGDMEAVRHFVAATVYTLYENILMFLFALLLMFTVNIKLALAMLLVLPLAALVTYYQSRAVKPAFHKIREQFSALNTFVQENISGNRVIRAFASETYEIEKFDQVNARFQEAELNAAAIWVKYVPVFELLSNFLMVILMIFGGYLVISEEMTLGNLVTISGYLWMLTNPLRMCGWWINDVQRFVTSVEKIYRTYSEEPKIQTPVLPYKRKQIEGEITFQNVSYQTDDEDIIQKVSFHVKKGQTIGIIGATGAGKSTIMNLLCRFYDTTEGIVFVDGVDVRDHDLYNLRSNIGIAMQDVFLFSDTVEGNIAYAKPSCSFEEVKEAAIMADANHFIKDMPEGYDTIVGERGVGLSGGQRQRISLARAILKKPPILILDDTTSAVDMETESYIQQQLKNLKNKCTIFVIAHRISSVIDADQILVMDSGTLIEQGTHRELIEKNGYYAKAFKHQYGAPMCDPGIGGIYGTE